MIDNKLCDDVDINRELKCLFTRTNILTRRFARCSKQVKLRLFRTYCLCFYDMGLWTNYHCYSFNKFAFGYVKCMKVFFGFEKFSNVSTMLMELGLPIAGAQLCITRSPHLLWSPFVIGQTIIFLPCNFYLLSFFFSSPNLSGHRLNAGLKCAARGSLQIRDAKSHQKSPSGHHRTTTTGYVFAIRARIDNRKKTC